MDLSSVYVRNVYCVQRPDIISILLLMDINYTPSRNFVLNLYKYVVHVVRASVYTVWSVQHIMNMWRECVPVSSWRGYFNYAIFKITPFLYV